jgi:hypothetical protein
VDGGVGCDIQAAVTLTLLGWALLVAILACHSWRAAQKLPFPSNLKHRIRSPAGISAPAPGWRELACGAVTALGRTATHYP